MIVVALGGVKNKFSCLASNQFSTKYMRKEFIVFVSCVLKSNIFISGTESNFRPELKVLLK